MARTSELLNLKKVKAAIDARLGRVLAAAIDQANVIDPSYTELIKNLTAIVLAGGKRVRPYLTYIGYVAYGGQEVEDILEVAAGLELFHNFLLIQDDVMDEDLIRHGRTNLSGHYADKFASIISVSRARQMGDNMALLGGDVALALSFEQISRSKFPPELRLAAINNLIKTMFEVGGGQQLDVAYSIKPAEQLSERELLKVCTFKTARYSFVSPLTTGAILAGAGEAEQVALARFAEPLGTAFQIQDDLLGLFGNETILGKSVLSDLREGKRTLLMHYGLKLAKSTERAVLLQALGNRRVGYSQLGRVRQILIGSGAKGRVESIAKAQIEVALANLRSINLSPQIQAELERLADLTIQRQV